ncbi:GntR family transcriptional regulator [Deinococcus misasensis]|uniref:GntR family transcriptional regulator n=1 Tax=Deinococcus misasensis TaxID=392413 RepID=UPI00054EFB2C|nr:GntR family transcriptional regulator [Deinococcus misasensis]
MKRGFQTRSPSSTPEMIANALRQAIIQGKYRGGEPLRQDEVASEFGVSKIPVREALYQLKAEGLVTFIPNRGSVVSELSIEEVDEIYLMREALEPTLLVRSIPALTPTDFIRARGLLDVMDETEDPASLAELNWEFHATLYGAANLNRLLESIRVLHTNSARYMAIYLGGEDRNKTSQQEHRNLLQACTEKDLDRSRALLIEHLETAKHHLLGILRQG